MERCLEGDGMFEKCSGGSRKSFAERLWTERKHAVNRIRRAVSVKVIENRKRCNVTILGEVKDSSLECMDKLDTFKNIGT